MHYVFFFSLRLYFLSYVSLSIYKTGKTDHKYKYEKSIQGRMHEEFSNKITVCEFFSRNI